MNDQGLIIVDLEKILTTISNRALPISRKDYQIESKHKDLLFADQKVGWSNYGILNSSFKYPKAAIANGRYILEICLEIEKIYLAINNSEAWVITRRFPYLDYLPTIINTPSRYKLKGQEYKIDKFLLPNKGLLKLAVCDWINKYKLLVPADHRNNWCKTMLSNIDAYHIVNNREYQQEFSRFNIEMFPDNTQKIF